MDWKCEVSCKLTGHWSLPSVVSGFVFTTPKNGKILVIEWNCKYLELIATQKIETLAWYTWVTSIGNQASL